MSQVQGAASQAAQVSQAAVLSAWQSGADLGVLIGVPRMVVQPYNGLPPSPAYHQALAKAQDEAAPIAKTVDPPASAKMGNKKYTTVEQWLELKAFLRNQGLMVSQVGGVSVDRAAGCHLRTQFRVIFLQDGTGELYTLDWPTVQTGMTPGNSTATAYTRPWKSFLRGLLMIPQVDEDELDQTNEDYERRVAQNEERKKNVEAAQRAAAARQQNGASTRAAPAEPELEHVQDAPAPRPQATRQAPTQQTRPQQPPARQAARPPVEREPIVSKAREILDAELVDENDPEVQQDLGYERAEQRRAPAQAQDDPGFEDLVGLGWKKDFAREIALIPSNEEIPQELRDEFLNAITEYFDGNLGRAMTLWEGTGFQPKGPRGPKPTGAQLRRYCVKVNWNERDEALGNPQGA